MMKPVVLHRRRREGQLCTVVTGVISPLLANLYLHLLDRIWERHNLETRLGARIVRYADDLVILCRQDVNRPMEVLKIVLDRLDLQLNQTKTKVVDAQQESFDFLGFTYHIRRSRFSGKVYPHVEPSKRSVQRLKDRVKRLTDRRRCPIPLGNVMTELNASLRGWTGYFHHRNSSKVFRNVKMQVEERLRTHLRRRHLCTAGRVLIGVFQTTNCTSDLVFTNSQQLLDGRKRMPCDEEHRKAVYGKTVCTV